jgi:hypothetical protein
MADEFIKGLAGFVIGGLGWMVFAGWYNTPGFESEQLIGPTPPAESLTFLDQVGIVLRDALLVLAVASAVTFWVLIPAYQELREYRADRS